MSDDHTFIRSFPHQEIVVHDPNIVTKQKCGRVGGQTNVMSHRLLDFDKHLAKKQDQVKKAG